MQTRCAITAVIMKSGRGRPPKNPDARRTNILRIRLTDEEREKLEAAPHEPFSNLSAWARFWLLHWADDET